MNLENLKHLIRAASAVTNSYEIVIFGSQSILGTIQSGPKELYFSEEADMFVDGKEELSDLIDSALGELSQFHTTFGYYAQGISSSVALLPNGWRDRLVKIQSAETDLKIGYCLSVEDLAFAKAAAFRPKDKDFVQILIKNGYVDPSNLSNQINAHPDISREKKDVIVEWVKGIESPSPLSRKQGHKYPGM